MDPGMFDQAAKQIGCFVLLCVLAAFGAGCAAGIITMWLLRP